MEPKVQSHPKEDVHFENLKDEAEHIEEEARMVLPGVQALFGFQFIAVLNARFAEFNANEQCIHWLALTMTAIAAVLAMAPAAFHRQAEPDRITRKFVKLATKWLCWSMRALAVGTCLDFYLIGRLISGSPLASGIVSIVLFMVFMAVWIVYPALQGAKASC